MELEVTGLEVIGLEDIGVEDDIGSCFESAETTPLGLMVIVVGVLERSSVVVVIVDVSMEYCDSVVAVAGLEVGDEATVEVSDDGDIMLLIVELTELGFRLLENCIRLVVFESEDVVGVLFGLDMLDLSVLEMTVLEDKLEGDELSMTLMEVCDVLEVGTLEVLLELRLLVVAEVDIMLDFEEPAMIGLVERRLEDPLD